ncbi:MULTISPECIES: universal stress protein [Weeksella]|uniref:UspA domain-containing protein n=1 Tax=Weeksella virosa (strain ATCC 43766 / DSM 16922 / JCM 21250 / CCUG 30538 / CDC 9751 / IAM 14551 / NBRC 16016 / NCTC 11634 / CL345/78) TaxID=865938 RepID=F0NXI6_WEEVC|nr:MULTISPECIES: universal stress protein [Weeksella]ADX67976.1 UspA domain-containing protein [Weeksella virosa DSM 16922]MDK7375787.1 universal stress protein [Weeksella virosa]MDK7676155.1 universal stress protein [Weeksella virosa]OFM83769.1 hypothetical protein HMPREF2660_09580 [Weeksella sp. HMSC059D05]SUP54284.1 Universal stress protein family [Weeksella virosa]
MKKILFPTDFSAAADNAFLYALNLAKLYDVDIDVLHVTSNVYLDTQEINRAKFSDYLDYLETIKDHQNEHFEINLQGYFESGDLIINMQEMLSKHDYLYVVMGTDGANTMNDKWLGTNTINAFNVSSVPVLAIPKNISFKPEKRLGFASRLLEKERRTLEKLIVLAKRNGGPLELVHIAKDNILDSDAALVKNFWEREFKDDELEITVLVNKDINKGIADFVTQKNIDVLCLIHRDMNSIERIFKGNYSKKLLQSLQIPILVYPEIN